MIYKGYDIRLEKNYFRITHLKTGAAWTEDTLKDAKNEIDRIDDISDAIVAEIRKAQRKGGSQLE